MRQLITVANNLRDFCLQADGLEPQINSIERMIEDEMMACFREVSHFEEKWLEAPPAGAVIASAAWQFQGDEILVLRLL